METPVGVRWLLPFAAIVALAFVLQVADLGARSLWFDEIYTVRIAGEPTLDELWASYRESERQPPLHYLLLRAWMSIAGSGDAAVRVPFAVLAAASVGLVGWLALRLLGRRAALYAAFLLAISPALLMFGRMARYYSLAVFLTLLSSVFLVEALRRHGAAQRTWRWWLLYCGATVALLLSSYVAIAVVACQVAAVLVACRGSVRQRARLTLAPALFVLLSLAWLGIGFDRLHGAVAERPPLGQPGATASALLDVAYPLYAFGLGVTQLPWEPAAAVGIAALVIAAPLGLRAVATTGGMAWLPIIMVTGVIGLVALAFIVKFHAFTFLATPARALPALPFFALIVAAGLARTPPRWAGLLLAGLVVSCAAADRNYYLGRQYHSPPYALPSRELAQTLVRIADSNDLVVTHAWTGLDYYLPHHDGGPRLSVVDRPLLQPYAARHDLSEAQPPPRAAPRDPAVRVWLVVAPGIRIADGLPEYERWLRRHARAVRTWRLVPTAQGVRKAREWLFGSEETHALRISMFELGARRAADGYAGEMTGRLRRLSGLVSSAEPLRRLPRKSPSSSTITRYSR